MSRRAHIHVTVLQALVCTAFLTVGTLAAPTAAAADAVPLVFVHGLKGAELVDQAGEVRWLTASGALGLSTPDLKLERRFENGVQPRGDLGPGGVLAKVVLIPWVGEVDVYGEWLARAAALGRPFHAFTYDWRREITETAARFETYLRDLKARYGVAPQVVAHSMGGLVTLAALAKDPSLFHSVVFAGVPFAGGVGFLPDLHAGRATGLSGSILGADVLQSYPSVFVLFPLVASDHLIDEDGKAVAVDFYDFGSWCRLKLGPCVAGDVDQPTRAFYVELMGRAKAFREAFLVAPRGALPKVLVVASKSQPTIVQAMQDGPDSEAGWDFATPKPADGDDRVAFTSAMPPAWVRYDVLETQHAHAALLGDPAVVDAIQKMVTP